MHRLNWPWDRVDGTGRGRRTSSALDRTSGSVRHVDVDGGDAARRCASLCAALLDLRKRSCSICGLGILILKLVFFLVGVFASLGSSLGASVLEVALLFDTPFATGFFALSVVEVASEVRRLAGFVALDEAVIALSFAERSGKRSATVYVVGTSRFREYRLLTFWRHRVSSVLMPEIRWRSGRKSGVSR